MNEGQRLWFQYVLLLNRASRVYREGREARLDRATRNRLVRSAKAGWPQAVDEVARQRAYGVEFRGFPSPSQWRAV